METYITICKIDSPWEYVVWIRKLKQGLCINLEGCDEEGDGKEFQKGRGYMYTYGIKQFFFIFKKFKKIKHTHKKTPPKTSPHYNPMTMM